MSKRKIKALVDEKFVNGWDDPRLFTLIALRRRGIPPGAIISFVSTLGVSTATSSIEVARFEQAIRQYLEGVPRLLMVMRPLKVTLENVPDDYLLMVEKTLHPKLPELGSATVPFTKTIYIERDDFRIEDSPDYLRLAPGKTIGLFQAPHPITCTSYKTDPDTGEVIELVCRLETEKQVKKPFIHWVADHPASGSPVRVDEVRTYHRLFKSDSPPADFRKDINPDSLEIVKGAFLETAFWGLAKRSIAEARKESQLRTDAALRDNVQSSEGDTPHATAEQLVGNECVRFQAVRVAYFALDKDAKLACCATPDMEPGRHEGDYIVLNRIVSLKEDAGKST